LIWTYGKTRNIKAQLEPQMFEEAVNHPVYGKQWKQAIHDEYNSIMKNQTWKLVCRLAN
jgi:hypothetical protein